MWSRLRRWILPPKPAVDPAFVARMHNARAFGVEQRRASVQSRRELQRDRDTRPCHGPIEDAIFPVWRKEDRP